MATYYYVRVSTGKQTTQNQVLQLQEAYAAPKHIFDDSGVSGKIDAMDRPAFAAMMQVLQQGDQVCVYSISRVGRNALDTLTVIEEMKTRGVKLVSLTEGFDATSQAGKIVLMVLAGVAEMEREQMVERIKAGLERARSEGVTLGRKVLPATQAAIELLKEGNTVADVMAITKLSKSQVYALNKQIKTISNLTK